MTEEASGNSEPRTLTFISRRSPYGEDYPRACLDMVMAAAVFDQTVNYVFMDDGVYQLLNGQQPARIHAKDLSAHFGALSLYGVENVFADHQSLLERGLENAALAMPVDVVDNARLQQLINHSDQVFLL
ncbi:MAG: sulfurtransferase complex subunit TusC [Pseudohongiellaceae bacterium]